MTSPPPPPPLSPSNHYHRCCVIPFFTPFVLPGDVYTMKRLQVPKYTNTITITPLPPSHLLNPSEMSVH
ncbi:hypothetical protein E2C01_065695 [Portunus trituberculatus]|uniref:Uncharacterized protein n=1 Tax=Portunus trituberculatus TaxID=210409 RepID=A0A5B7HRU1_PORTR|nr:hypothetical protein [Portunus trituberculatus]